MIKLRYFVPIAALLVANVGLAQVSNSKSVTLEGSQDIPDGIAFTQFLAMIAPKPEAPGSRAELVFLASALDKHDEVRGDYEQMRSRLDVLDTRRRATELRQAEWSRDVLCVENRASRSTEASFAALNEAEDANIAAAELELEEYMATLTEKEAKSFRSYLEKIKSNTTFVRVDNREVIDEPDVASAVEHECMLLNDRILRNGGAR